MGVGCWRAAAVATLVVLVGCGGDDPTGAPRSITLTLGAQSIAVTQGTSASVAVTVAREGDVGDVTIAVSGLPAGVTAAPLTLPAGTSNGTVSLSAAATAAVGTGSAIVTAAASDVTPVTATLAVTVVQSSPGAFNLTAPSGTLSVPQNGSANITLTISRTAPFTGAVGLTAVNLPAGFTVTFNPQSVTGTTSTATIAAAGTVPLGNYSIALQGSGSGVTNQTLTVSVTVIAPVGYTLSLSAPTLSVTAGSQNSVTVNVNRTGGFAGTVTLTASGGPAGTTASFSPPGVSANSSVLTLAVAGTVAAGNYPITITGAATGLPNQTATLTLTVVSPPSFSLSLSPTTVQLQQGSSANVSVTITRTGGFSGAIALTATGLPPGVTASFNPASTTGNSAVFTLNANSGALPNTYSVTVTGSSGSGAPPSAQETDFPAAVDINVTLTLVVTVPSGSTTVNVDFCGATGYPVAVFYQNGTSPWTAASGLNGQFSFTISQPVGGLAWVVDNGGGDIEVHTYLGTRAELQAFNVAVSQCNGSTNPGKSVNLTTVGLGTQDVAQLALGNAVTSTSGATGGTGVFRSVRQGPVDLIGGRSAITVAGQSTTFDLTKVLLQRGLNPTAGTTVTADFNGTSSYTPVAAQLTVNGIGADPTVMGVGYWTGTKSFGPLYADGTGSNAATRTWKGFPGAAQMAGDFHFLQANAYSPNAQNPARIRAALVVTQGVANQTLTLGPALSNVTVSTVRAAPLRLQASVARQAEYASVYDFVATQGGKEFNVQVTAAYLGSPTTTVVQWPDFQGIPGFNDAWLPLAGSPISWTFGGTGFTGSPAPSEGKVVSLGIQLGSFTP
jgi:hypothetical protein